MTITGIRILPPLAFARLGSAKEPLDNYTIRENAEHPLGYREIVPAATLIVDEATGEIRESRVPAAITFKELAPAGVDGQREERIRPVAPFFEVFAEIDHDVLQPLTVDLLRQHGLDAGAIAWRVCVANRKVWRRTRDDHDVVSADTGWFSGHDAQPLTGRSDNFVDGATLPFGHVRYIRPNRAFPGVRLRFTPAQGLIYGPRTGKPDRAIPADRAIYDASKSWYQWQERDPVYETLPPSLFAIEPPAPPWLNDNIAVSRGYLDDACDGIIEVGLTQPNGARLTATARVAATPPALVPDSLFVRSLADDLEQALIGPRVPDDEPYEQTLARAEDIVRRAYETVRFMNVAFMNGNTFKGRPPLSFDTMPAEEAFDTERLERPVMTPSSVDTLAVMALHQQVFTALRGGSGAWFVRLLRQPEDAADYTDPGRRKMPALMCGADNNYLALTRRQIDTVRRVAQLALFADDTPRPYAGEWPGTPAGLTPRNLTAQLFYAAAGNPTSTRPVVAVGNCTPGLEVDFRAVWRKVFEGIVLQEAGNVVLETDAAHGDLRHHRLLRVDGIRVVGQMKGPSPASPDEWVPLFSTANRDAAACLEWSNALAHVLHDKKGQLVKCDFTKHPSLDPAWLPDDENDYLTRELRIRAVFDEGTAVISQTLVEPGELTQGLCSPWQNDYRECSCYYWASARPDFVNVEPTPEGTSSGDNWLQKERTGSYVPDDYRDSRLIMYDDLFLAWEKYLRFQVRGRDVPDKGGEPS